MKRLSGLLPVILAIACCWLLCGAGGCLREASPQLVRVSDIAPREVEPGDRVAIVGDGFPSGREARVTFRGTLHRPGEKPERAAEIVVSGVVAGPEQVEVAFTETTQAMFCRAGDRASHTTFEGDLEVAFAAATPGAAPVAGVLRHVVFDVRPSAAPGDAEQQREGAKLLAWVGLEATAGPSGLAVTSVEPGSRAEAAGFAPGDLGRIVRRRARRHGGGRGARHRRARGDRRRAAGGRGVGVDDPDPGRRRVPARPARRSGGRGAHRPERARARARPGSSGASGARGLAAADHLAHAGGGRPRVPLGRARRAAPRRSARARGRPGVRAARGHALRAVPRRRPARRGAAVRRRRHGAHGRRSAVERHGLEGLAGRLPRRAAARARGARRRGRGDHDRLASHAGDCPDPGGLALGLAGLPEPRRAGGPGSAGRVLPHRAGGARRAGHRRRVARRGLAGPARAWRSGSGPRAGLTGSWWPGWPAPCSWAAGCCPG